MFVRSQEDANKASPAASTTTTRASQGTVQLPILAQQQSGVSIAEEKQRYTTIAPRPSLVAQQPSKPPTARKKTNAAAKEQRRPAGTAKSAKPRAEKKAKQAALVASASAADSSAAPQQASTDLSGSNAFAALDADDRLIQELLAGIPASAWLPTDPLTSEDWFLDPGASVGMHDNVFPLAAQQQQQPPPLPPSSSSTHIPGTLNALLASSQPASNTVPPNSTSLDAAAAGSHQAPDMRVLAGVRQKRDTPLLSGRPAKGNPLSGFAKKHGVGYAVGNQVAIISPALLSSSPPSAKQLRQNPYKYYSPPKPVPRSQPKSAQSKGRNLMLGATSKSTAKHAASSPVKTTGVASGNGRLERPGSVKWEIAQDKALLSGVRQLRWGTRDGEHRTAEEARDPSRFVEDDWERISREVSLTGAQRSARQCRRRWAWLHAHLGSSIMEFVDTSPTPQSSAQSTPLVPRETEGAPTHIRNLRLADLPRSSPPIHPVRLRESRVDSTPDVSVHNTPVLDPLKERGTESRWDDPAYCQLLADVVQALSDPQSRAAKVARMFAPETAATKAVSTPVPTPMPGSSVAPAPTFISAAASAASAAPAAPLPVVSLGAGTQQLMPHLMLAPPVAMSVPPFSDLPAIANLVTSSAMPLFTSDHHSARLSNTPLILPSATKSPAVTAVADELAAHRPMDQDLSVYMQFLQSLTSDQIDLGNAWSTLFEDAGGNAPGSSAAEPIAGLGPMTMSVCDVPMKPVSDKVEKKSGSAGNAAASIEDDDMEDGDFVLDEEDDDDDEDEDDDDDAEDTETVSRPASDGLRPLGHVGTVGSRFHLSQAAAAAGGGGSISDGAWNLALSELGLGSTSATTSMAPGLSLPFGQVSSELGDNHGLFAPDPLLRQLMQGVADLGRNTSEVSGVSSGGGGGSDSIVGSQSVWLPNAASGSTMLPQWDTTNGFSLATTAAPSQISAKAAGKVPDVSATTGAPKDTAQVNKGVSVTRTASQQNKQQQSQSQPPADLLLTRRGLLKAPRKRHSAISVGSNSYKKAMLAAERAGPPASIDVDGLLGSEAGGMDTEMSGLYQDALQEGEELDVQEESLQADNSEFLFMGDQMAQLRAQQLMNFQLVVQAFLIACAELGPHAPRARHWRRQLDQLALWHSLGTRESPTDLVSGEGLARFAQLIESAERRGAGGMTESAGRFAPNPTSFFAIPGITAIIPDIYEAVDEIHRAAHVTADSDGSGAPEVRSLNAAMEFTPRCNCTAVRGFKSAIVLEWVFPRLHLQLRNGKRKAETETESTVAGKRQAAPPQSSSRAGDTADVAATAGQLAQMPGTKALLSKPVASRPGSGSSGGQGGHLPTLMPQVVSEILPSCTQADQRAIIDEIRTHMRTFKRDLHRVPRYRRRVYLQGDDGVPRLDWIPVKIQPLGFPAVMQCVIAPLLAHCGFQESMLPHIVMVRKPKNRIHFLESEDALLLLGLRMFGIEDLASVRVHLIPCKTASQLRNRMNNLRARRQAPNAIKDFCLRRIAPFTLEEEEILRVGVLVYGDEFRRVNTNQNLLINRPILALSHVWNHVRKKPETVK
ncbi:hypothetical protein GGH93_001497 [Coemansia aciculifera]|nr:hypothetical protein GGH93_001497 [Coemansia aciculifera]